MITSILFTSLLLAPTPFDVIDLGCISSGDCFVSDLNESGQVAGIGDAPNGFGLHSFIWDGNKLIHIHPLTYPNGGYCWAFGMNDFGNIVGYSSANNGQFHTFLWDGKQMLDLGSPSWAAINYSQGHDINNNGWIVGFAGAVPNDIRGYIKHDAVWDEIPTFGGVESKAFAINEINDVVGVSRNTDGILRAFGIPSGNISQMTDLGDLGGGAAQARDVNNNRTIVGFSTINDGNWHAFKWTLTDGMIDLGTLGGIESRAYAISDNGVIVGESETATGETHGFIWIDGEMFDLNNYIVPDMYINIVSAKGINSNGEVAVTVELVDGTKNSYLLTPMSETIPEDINGDGTVNVLDLLAVVGSWGPCKICPEDINGDGMVDVTDLLAIISVWST
ncbi:MAG TPA: hypothetical protein EYO01_00695 [Phycisphaerales bacterium]|nr:hypothetical protein [Phycisphaerales bacterium]HIB01088.1 hypothetical protein [Phycisphaerales bacterium]HIB50154.1 hypothetical protein [Phycisphaerales bacterium]HIN83590.1 hypothetical protein [Phycisphaerales bacterium]HIO20244.1 hypothetical protein [Phycisphaerales bacterium]